MKSYPLFAHNVVLFLVSRWKQMLGVRRVVSVADRTWENIDLTFSSLWVQHSILITSIFGNCYDDSLHLGIITVLLEVLWASRSKIAAKWAITRAWAGWWFFWEEEEVCGCRNKSRGATMGPRGRGCALDPRAQVLAPPAVFTVPDILKYSRKNHISISGHLENFYFRCIFILHG